MIPELRKALKLLAAVLNHHHSYHDHLDPYVEAHATLRKHGYETNAAGFWHKPRKAKTDDNA